MMIDKPSVLYDQEQVRARVAELGAAITAAYAGREVCVVGLMKSCMVFMADLIRAIPLDMTCHFLRASALPGAGPGAACTDIVYSTEIPYAGRHILLLDDIVDTGITLNYLLGQIREARPAALKVCALVDKPGDRKVDVHPDWTAFTLDEPEGRFLVGYGLDFGEHYRGLPFIGTIPRPVPPPSGAQES
jgi:hypoxanthine phosphoribosyltransferase